MNLLIYFDEGVSPRSVRFLTRALQLEDVDKFPIYKNPHRVGTGQIVREATGEALVSNL